MNTKNDSSNLIPIIVGISGHREIDIEIINPLKQKLKEILSYFQNSYPDSPIKLFTPLAVGADQIVAKVALELNIDLVVPYPCPLKNT
jgi:hypothetical protein